MAKRALLVGCNYEGTRFSLRGCIHDADTMGSLIVSEFGFEMGDVKIYDDLTHSKDVFLNPGNPDIQFCENILLKIIMSIHMEIAMQNLQNESITEQVVHAGVQEDVSEVHIE
ncbi:hypothetical protein V6N13_107562 [Hibiscus sabdariffa]|uniref:Peptidase C14 caspase domain-containing protein n=1 Tax=Hibiscus sabdariffa TaxID=183260 RepID=A0ABR2SQD8_9ROSI